MSKFLELLPANCTNKKAFSLLCEILQTDYEWIADELKAELRAEAGELKIEEYIEREAAILVHREFGSSKRLSEAEKKEIKDLVALRTQYAKEVWMRQLALAKKYLVEQTERNKEKDEYAKKLIEKVNAFLKLHKARLSKIPKYATEQSTTEMFRERERQQKNLDKPLVNILEESIEDLREMTQKSLEEKDHLQEEKVKALAVLNVKDPNAKLDKELEQALERAAKELMAQQDDIKQREQRAAELRAKIAELKENNEKAMSAKDKEIDELTQHLAQCHSKIKDVKDEIKHLQDQLAYTRAELLRCKKKSKVLEQTRRLGYLEQDKKDQQANNKDANRNKGRKN